MRRTATSTTLADLPHEKRRTRDSSSSSAQKAKNGAQLRRTRLPAETLRWKPIKATGFPGMDGGGGMMMLEELDDVDVEWEEDEEGRKVARFVVCLA